MSDLVLSIFPGIDLLGRAFEEQGYCVVRGPDVLWGGDVRDFHPPAGMFEGVIGGDPCQEHSVLAYLVRHIGNKPKFPDMTPDYVRIITEAQPRWFLRENVSRAPTCRVEGYDLWSVLLTDADVGGVQPRLRRFWFGMQEGLWPNVLQSPLASIEYVDGRITSAGTLACDSGIAYEEQRRRKVVAGHGLTPGQRMPVTLGQNPAPGQRRTTKSVLADARRTPVKIGGSGKLKRSIVADSRVASQGDRVRSREKGAGALPGMGSVLPIEDACEAMGLPRDFTKEMPFTMHGKRSVIGNGVPMAMGRAVAKAVRRATA